MEIQTKSKYLHSNSSCDGFLHRHGLCQLLEHEFRHDRVNELIHHLSKYSKHNEGNNPKEETRKAIKEMRHLAKVITSYPTIDLCCKSHLSSLEVEG